MSFLSVKLVSTPLWGDDFFGMFSIFPFLHTRVRAVGSTMGRDCKYEYIFSLALFPTWYCAKQESVHVFCLVTLSILHFENVIICVFYCLSKVNKICLVFSCVTF